MQDYVQARGIKTDALLMLGDNWYGPLPGGVKDERWKTQFEEMYPKSVFDCPAYAILGNHDYQRMPESKVDAELEYAKAGRDAVDDAVAVVPVRVSGEETSGDGDCAG